MSVNSKDTKIWANIAQRAGVSRIQWEDGHTAAGGIDVARRVVGALLDEELLLSAVRASLEDGPGSEAAASLLAWLSPDCAVRALVLVVDGDRSLDQRQLALTRLGDVDGVDAISTLIRVLRAADDDLSMTAAQALSQHLWRGVAADELLDEAARALAAFPDPEIARRGREALEER